MKRFIKTTNRQQYNGDSAPKPQKSLGGQTCPICRAGKFHLVQINYTENVVEENPIDIHGIWVDRCDNCSEIVFPGDTTAFIEAVVADYTQWKLDIR
jgi:hypothetical protein